MRIWLTLISIIFGIGLSVAHADYEAGKRAYDAGDYAAAYELWLPLAEGGNVQAVHKLGYMFMEGLGRKANSDEAIKWYTISASKGYVKSQRNLGYLNLSMKPAIKHVPIAAKWLYIADQSGDTIAKEILLFITSHEYYLENSDVKVLIDGGIKDGKAWLSDN